MGHPMSVRKSRTIFWVVYGLVCLVIVPLDLFISVFGSSGGFELADLEKFIREAIGWLVASPISHPFALVLLAPGWLLIIYAVMEWGWAFRRRTKGNIFWLTFWAAYVVLALWPVASIWREDRVLRSYEHGPSFGAKIDVSFEFDGAPVRIQRVVECRTFLTSMPLKATPNDRPVVEYAVTPGVIGARLDSGEGVFLWTPYLCEHTAELGPDGGIKSVKAVSKYTGPVPIIGWTKDPDAIDSFELYFSRAYYDNPLARVQNVQTQVSACVLGAASCEADERDEFAWLTTQRLYEERYDGPSLYFDAFGFIAVEGSEWRPHSEELAEALETFVAPAFIDRTRLPSGRWRSSEASDVIRKVLGKSGRFIQQRFVPDPDKREKLISPGQGINARFQVMTAAGEGLRFADQEIAGWGTFFRRLTLAPPYPTRNSSSPTYYLRDHRFIPDQTNERLKGTNLESNLYYPSNVIYDPETDRLILVTTLTYAEHVIRPLGF